MIGTIVQKPIENYEEYKKIAEWCNLNNATIIDKGNYYEVTEIKEEILTEKEKALKQIIELESQQTPRILRNAALGDEFAINKLRDIENNISVLREKINA